MKTTIEIPDDLLRQVKALAQRERTTVRALVEAGLLMLLKEQRERPQFRLREASFEGHGFAHAANWESLRDTLYDGRGS